jgi:hypothetical protein
MQTRNLTSETHEDVGKQKLTREVDVVPPLRAQVSEADTGRQQEDTCAVHVMSAPTHLLPKFVLQTGRCGHVGPFASSRLAGFLVSSYPRGPKRTATVPGT